VGARKRTPSRDYEKRIDRLTFSLIIQVVLAAFKFPEEFRKLLKFIEKTPAEKQLEIYQRVNSEMEEYLAGERIKWN